MPAQPVRHATTKTGRKMIILTDCLHELADEGSINLTNSLVRLMKKEHPQIRVVSYKNRNVLTDVCLNLNKLFLNREMYRLIKKDGGTVLYIPQAANSAGSILRLWVLSRIMRCSVTALFTECKPMTAVMRCLLKKSAVKIAALSREACAEFDGAGCKETLYLKTGVDTRRFQPADKNAKGRLRDKYGLQEGKKVLLHVGHLKRGRNLGQVLKVNKDWDILIVVSTHTAAEKDEGLRQELLQREGLTIIDSYIENIEELYQLADVYFFPVAEKGNCISAPLSVFEAAACNLPVVATRYGNLVDFLDEPGFRFLNSFDADEMNQKLSDMERIKEFDNRAAVLEYDWENACKALIAFSER